jgi:hypothetical protein
MSVGRLLAQLGIIRLLKIFEAGVRRFHEWADPEPRRHILVAVARYLAAHSPKERDLRQTADIADRLSRGDPLHEDAG